MPNISSGDIITSPQTITANWTDVGSAIQTQNYSYFTSFIQLDINNSQNVQFRYVYLQILNGIEYPSQIKMIKPTKTLLDPLIFEINTDADQNIPISTEIDNNVYAIKLQVRALTVGATAGIVSTARYTQGYRQ